MAIETNYFMVSLDFVSLHWFHSATRNIKNMGVQLKYMHWYYDRGRGRPVSSGSIQVKVQSLMVSSILLQVKFTLVMSMLINLRKSAVNISHKPIPNMVTTMAVSKKRVWVDNTIVDPDVIYYRAMILHLSGRHCRVLL